MPDSRENRREHFRIRYPEADRPSFQVGKSLFEVLDLAEKGIRFLVAPSHNYVANQQVKGTIIFRSGKKWITEGKVLRYIQADHSCVMQLKRTIPLAYIMEEQRLLLQKYNKLSS